MIGWIYALVVHWGWGKDGWLKNMGFQDFAGSGVVHLAMCNGVLASIRYTSNL